MSTLAQQHTDAHGNPTSGARDAVERYDTALDRLLRYHPDVVTLTASLMENEPDFGMGQILMGYLCLTSTDTPDLAGAQAAAAALDGIALNEREAAHRAVIGAWLDGDWHGAARQLDALLIRWPSDLLALLVGHQLDFFTGDAANLRDRVGRSFGAVDPKHPHHGFVRGMYAFGLEESGHYEQAEAHGHAALEINPDDVWATHAVVHTYEMRGLVDTGIHFLRDREKDWAKDNLFTVHNWWHLALYLLEAERPSDSLVIYDTQVHGELSGGVPLEMLDASALLWRLLLDGVDTGGRFSTLADAWATRTGDEPWYTFNDLHAVMALSGAGRIDDARSVIDRLDRYVTSGGNRDEASNVAMTAEIGLPASRAAVAFVEGRHADVVAELAPIRARFQRFGGSHAQRDVLQRTLLEAAILSGQLNLARALIRERLAARQFSVYALRHQAEVLRRTGDNDAAARADTAATANRDRFAAAV
jgi:tetratricopeptide (TPR) repeat protein